MTCIIKRTGSIEDGTFGTFWVNERPFCLTLEETWRNNEKGNSCIPAGNYHVRKYSGTKFKDVWEIVNVPNRTAILIHAGNTDSDTSGCILVGMEYSTFNNKSGILRSVEALNKCRKVLPDLFNLQIINCF